MRAASYGTSGLLPALLCAVTLAAACKGNETHGQKPAKLDSETSKDSPIATDRAPAVTEIEGLDLTEIEPKRRNEVLRLLNDTFCYCGCPRTLAACLANKADCSCVRCSERMASFITNEIKEGMSIEDVEAQLLEGFSEGFNGRQQQFAAAEQPVKGPADAPFTITEFADFKCPHCAAAYEVLDEVVEKRGDVKLVYYYFPLGGNGERSVRAAEAAEEARAQGKFWELARTMFRNQHALEDEDLEQYAAAVGLDMDRYKNAMKNRTHRDQVVADKRIGEESGVQSTPSLFINGRPFGLARTAENLQMRFAMESERGRCD